MNEQIKQALKKDHVIDITTTGRKSGEARRIEIWFHNVEDRVFITGTPGTRDWYSNMVAHPEIMFHLKESVQADLPAAVTPITDHTQRRAIMSKVLTIVGRPQSDLDNWVAGSPLVEVNFIGN
jgi:deazaflavin-dependent oxidoreductase (nitroreductase family)